MDYVKLPDGAEIHYEILGAGVPLVFLHAGLGFDSSYLKNAFAPLADAGLKLVFFDFRGNGKSSRRQADFQFNIETLVEDVENLRANLDLGKIILYGHSFGGVVAQKYALRSAENLRGLILDSTYPAFGAGEFAALERYATPVEMRTFLEAFGSFVPDDESFARALKRVLPLYFYNYDETKAAQFYGKMSFSAAAFNRSSKVMQSVNITEKLSQIETPTLVIAGRRDLFGLAQTAKRMSEKISRSRLAIFDHSGHFPLLEETTNYLKEVTDFTLSLS